MGPTALFDKSFLQSLTVDESVFFDQFFHTIICPLFHVETLADLEKAVRQGRTPEDEVGIIADKVPQMHSAPTLSHKGLAIQNLLGNSVPMDGRMILAGTVRRIDKALGVFHEPTAEAEAYLRWQERKFLEVERQFAKGWRDALTSIDLETIAAGVRAFGIDPASCKSLEQAKAIAEGLVAGRSVPDLIKLILLVLNADSRIEKPAVERWKASGCSTLAEYAPYAAHILLVEAFFQVALGSDKIGTSRNSNRTDIVYLYYLPFCKVFVSSDRLHERCVPLFLRQDQSFVWGQDLKQDLQRLVGRYASLPNEEKEKGVMCFASTPPHDDAGCLVSTLWDRLLGTTWRDDHPQLSGKTDLLVNRAIRELLSKLDSKFLNAPVANHCEIAADLSNVGMVRVERRISPKKGQFWQGPKRLSSC